jgi:hypothetical protein
VEDWRLILQPLTKRSIYIAPLTNKHGGMWVGEILKCDPGWLRMKNYVIVVRVPTHNFNTKELISHV